MKEVIRFIINIILLVTISYSATEIGFKGWQYYKADRTYSKVEEFKPPAENSKKDNIVHNGNEDNYKKLKNENADYKFWISVPEFEIDYPVVQGEDNEFYLNHDFYKSKSLSGSIFVDYRNDVENDKNLIIYGHNMKTGMMFANLRNYHTDKNYYAAHPYMYIYTPSQDYRLDLYAGFVCEHADEIYSTSLTQDQLKAMAAKSDFKANIGVPTGKTVTLSTCSYEFADARYVVIGALTPIS